MGPGGGELVDAGPVGGGELFGGGELLGAGEPVETGELVAGGEAVGPPPVFGCAATGGGSPAGSALSGDSVVMSELRAILASNACGPGADDCSGNTQKWVAEEIRDPTWNLVAPLGPSSAVGEPDCLWAYVACF